MQTKFLDKTQFKYYYKESARKLKILKEKQKKRFLHKIAVTLTSNNTFINYSQIKYKLNLLRNSEVKSSRTLTYTSGGLCDFKGSKKASPMANATIAEKAAVKFKKFGHRNIALYLNSTKKKRMKETVINLAKGGLAIGSIWQKSRVPFNGTRPKKQRRK